MLEILVLFFAVIINFFLGVIILLRSHKNIAARLFSLTIFSIILWILSNFFADVIKATMYVTDMSLYGQINEVYASYMTESFPAREAIEVKALPKGAKIEISMVATV